MIRLQSGRSDSTEQNVYESVVQSAPPMSRGSTKQTPLSGAYVEWHSSVPVGQL
jgi:hypothetical protein